MKKKIAALILTIVMACSFCMTSCIAQVPAAQKKGLPFAAIIRVVFMSPATANSFIDNYPIGK